MPERKIDRIPMYGRAWGIVSYGKDFNSLLYVVRGNIRDGHFSIDVDVNAGDSTRRITKEGKEEDWINIEDFEELERRLYIKATEVAQERLHSL